MYSFPVIKGRENPQTVLKINTMLQLTELSKTIHDTDKNIFSELYDTSGEVSFGVTSLGFEILTNNSKNLSIAINAEWCGASCGHWTNYYNFNPRNGDAISLYDLIDSAKITAATDSILEKRIRHFMNQLKNITDEEMIDTNEVINDMNNSNLSYFFIRNDSIFIDDEECLSKFEKHFDLDMKTVFTLEELNPWLNEYGKAVLSDSKKEISNFRGKDFPQLFYGQMKDSLSFFFSFRLYYEYNGSGFFAFTKDGIAHSLDGTYDNNHFELTEHDINFNDIGFIKADYHDGKISGNYFSKEGKILFPFNAIRM